MAEGNPGSGPGPETGGNTSHHGESSRAGTALKDRPIITAVIPAPERTQRVEDFVVNPVHINQAGGRPGIDGAAREVVANEVNNGRVASETFPPAQTAEAATTGEVIVDQSTGLVATEQPEPKKRGLRETLHWRTSRARPDSFKGESTAEITGESTSAIPTAEHPEAFTSDNAQNSLELTKTSTQDVIAEAKAIADASSPDVVTPPKKRRFFSGIGRRPILSSQPDQATIVPTAVISEPRTKTAPILVTESPSIDASAMTDVISQSSEPEIVRRADFDISIASVKAHGTDIVQNAAARIAQADVSERTAGYLKNYELKQRKIDRDIGGARLHWESIKNKVGTGKDVLAATAKEAGKHPLQTLERFYDIGFVNKAVRAQLERTRMAQMVTAGLNDFSPTMRQDIQQAAQRRIDDEKSKKGIVRRTGDRVQDFIAAATADQKRLSKAETQILADLRIATTALPGEELTLEQQALLGTDLMNKYNNELIGQTAAQQAMVDSQAAREALGEVTALQSLKGIAKVELIDEMQGMVLRATKGEFTGAGAQLQILDLLQRHGLSSDLSAQANNMQDVISRVAEVVNSTVDHIQGSAQVSVTQDEILKLEKIREAARIDEIMGFFAFNEIDIKTGEITDATAAEVKGTRSNVTKRAIERFRKAGREASELAGGHAAIAAETLRASKAEAAIAAVIALGGTAASRTLSRGVKTATKAIGGGMLGAMAFSGGRAFIRAGSTSERNIGIAQTKAARGEQVSGEHGRVALIGMKEIGSVAVDLDRTVQDLQREENPNITTVRNVLRLNAEVAGREQASDSAKRQLFSPTADGTLPVELSLVDTTRANAIALLANKMELADVKALAAEYGVEVEDSTDKREVLLAINKTLTDAVAANITSGQAITARLESVLSGVEVSEEQTVQAAQKEAKAVKRHDQLRAAKRAAAFGGGAFAEIIIAHEAAEAVMEVINNFSAHAETVIPNGSSVPTLAGHGNGGIALESYTQHLSSNSNEALALIGERRQSGSGTDVGQEIFVGPDRTPVLLGTAKFENGAIVGVKGDRGIPQQDVPQYEELFAQMKVNGGNDVTYVYDNHGGFNMIANGEMVAQGIQLKGGTISWEAMHGSFEGNPPTLTIAKPEYDSLPLPANFNSGKPTIHDGATTYIDSSSGREFYFNTAHYSESQGGLVNNGKLVDNLPSLDSNIAVLEKMQFKDSSGTTIHNVSFSYDPTTNSWDVINNSVKIADIHVDLTTHGGVISDKTFGSVSESGGEYVFHQSRLNPDSQLITLNSQQPVSAMVVEQSEVILTSDDKTEITIAGVTFDTQGNLVDSHDHKIILPEADVANINSLLPSTLPTGSGFGLKYIGKNGTDTNWEILHNGQPLFKNVTLTGAGKVEVKGVAGTGTFVLESNGKLEFKSTNPIQTPPANTSNPAPAASSNPTPSSSPSSELAPTTSGQTVEVNGEHGLLAQYSTKIDHVEFESGPPEQGLRTILHKDTLRIEQLGGENVTHIAFQSIDKNGHIHTVLVDAKHEHGNAYIDLPVNNQSGAAHNMLTLENGTSVNAEEFSKLYLNQGNLHHLEHDLPKGTTDIATEFNKSDGGWKVFNSATVSAVNVSHNNGETTVHFISSIHGNDSIEKMHQVVTGNTSTSNNGGPLPIIQNQPVEQVGPVEVQGLTTNTSGDLIVGSTGERVLTNAQFGEASEFLNKHFSFVTTEKGKQVTIHPQVEVTKDGITVIDPATHKPIIENIHFGLLKVGEKNGHPINHIALFYKGQQPYYSFDTSSHQFIVDVNESGNLPNSYLDLNQIMTDINSKSGPVTDLGGLKVRGLVKGTDGNLYLGEQKGGIRIFSAEEAKVINQELHSRVQFLDQKGKQFTPELELNPKKAGGFTLVGPKGEVLIDNVQFTHDSQGNLIFEWDAESGIIGEIHHGMTTFRMDTSNPHAKLYPGQINLTEYMQDMDSSTGIQVGPLRIAGLTLVQSLEGSGKNLHEVTAVELGGNIITSQKRLQEVGSVLSAHMHFRELVKSPTGDHYKSFTPLLKFDAASNSFELVGPNNQQLIDSVKLDFSNGDLNFSWGAANGLVASIDHKDHSVTFTIEPEGKLEANNLEVSLGSILHFGYKNSGHPLYPSVTEEIVTLHPNNPGQMTTFNLVGARIEHGNLIGLDGKQIMNAATLQEYERDLSQIQVFNADHQLVQGAHFVSDGSGGFQLVDGSNTLIAEFQIRDNMLDWSGNGQLSPNGRIFTESTTHHSNSVQLSEYSQINEQAVQVSPNEISVIVNGRNINLQGVTIISGKIVNARNHNQIAISPQDLQKLLSESNIGGITNYVKGNQTINITFENNGTWNFDGNTFSLVHEGGKVELKPSASPTPSPSASPSSTPSGTSSASPSPSPTPSGTGIASASPTPTNLQTGSASPWGINGRPDNYPSQSQAGSEWKDDALIGGAVLAGGLTGALAAGEYQNATGSKLQRLARVGAGFAVGGAAAGAVAAASPLAGLVGVPGTEAAATLVKGRITDRRDRDDAIIFLDNRQPSPVRDRAAEDYLRRRNIDVDGTTDVVPTTLAAGLRNKSIVILRPWRAKNDPDPMRNLDRALLSYRTLYGSPVRQIWEDMSNDLQKRSTLVDKNGGATTLRLGLSESSARRLIALSNLSGLDISPFTDEIRTYADTRPDETEGEAAARRAQTREALLTYLTGLNTTTLRTIVTGENQQGDGEEPEDEWEAEEAQRALEEQQPAEAQRRRQQLQEILNPQVDPVSRAISGRGFLYENRRIVLDSGIPATRRAGDIALGVYRDTLDIIDAEALAANDELPIQHVMSEISSDSGIDRYVVDKLSDQLSTLVPLLNGELNNGVSAQNIYGQIRFFLTQNAVRRLAELLMTPDPSNTAFLQNFPTQDTTAVQGLLQYVINPDQQTFTIPVVQRRAERPPGPQTPLLPVAPPIDFIGAERTTEPISTDNLEAGQAPFLEASNVRGVDETDPDLKPIVDDPEVAAAAAVANIGDIPAAPLDVAPEPVAESSSEQLPAVVDPRADLEGQDNGGDNSGSGLDL